MLRHAPLTLILLATVAACGEGAPPAEPPSYHRDIKPLMDRYCNECHRSGEIAPFSLTSYDAVQRHAPLVRAAVEAGRMPPWQPADDGMPLRYSRKLRPEDKQLLLGWLDGGMPQGDPAAAPRTDFPAAERTDPPRADMTLRQATPFLPASTGTDDYHCFVFDPKLDRDRYLTAAQVLPDNRPIVHHVVVFLISPGQADKVRALDPTGAGYTCFGGPGNGIGGGVAVAWAPGSTSMRSPAGTAMKVPKGSLLVMQMHYNLVANDGKGDRTGVELELSDAVPDHELRSLFLLKPDLKIAPGDAASLQAIDGPVSLLQQYYKLPPGELVVYDALPHMHVLGKRITLSLDENTKIIEIPRWDFHWQGTYAFREPVRLRPSDVLHLECLYDNSAGNQPVIDGQRHPPREVKFGESTFDEMCVVLMNVAVN